MRYSTALCTDVGIEKSTNQDSALLMQAETACGPVLMAAVCDGMGGLAKGEVASASVIRRLEAWFNWEFPTLLGREDFPFCLKTSWESLIEEENRRISSYGRANRLNLGTTVVVFLMVGDAYYILHVGDSRVYLLEEQLYQLTRDQTLIQNEIDKGRMTVEQARNDNRRSVLLQCVGASSTVRPDFLTGRVKRGNRYLLCSDGFRHEISPAEIYAYLSAESAPGPEEMQAGLEYLIRLNKSRKEKDNITALLICI